MLRVVNLVYHHQDCKNPEFLLPKHKPALGFAKFIDQRIDLQFVQHFNYQGAKIIDGINYTFFKSKNRFWYIPFNTHQYIKSQQPDVVIVEGLIFPLQLIPLKVLLGKHCKIIVQHHGEKPFSGIKLLCQKIADYFVDRYLFTALNNATAWIQKGVIKNANKIVEVLEASTDFKRLGKAESQVVTGMPGKLNFLWVGRLDANKDPVTVLKAFEKFAANRNHVNLYMIYNQENMLAYLQQMIAQSDVLNRAVKLIGKVDHNQLSQWYRAADFYISASHKEGSGYALLEAMACGCIPVVTNIPSFAKITANGKHGMLYTPGHFNELLTILESLENIDRIEYSNQVETHFKKQLSFKNIADDIVNVCHQLADVKR